MVAHLATEVSNDNGVIITVVNPQSKAVRLKSGLIVGQIHTIKKVSAGAFTTIAGQHISLVNDPAQIELPTNESETHLDENQKQTILKLLDKYPTLKGEKGLGTTSLLTKHKIETGSAAPVKAPSWRRPEIEHQQIEQEVKTMREARVIEKIIFSLECTGAVSQEA